MTTPVSRTSNSATAPTTQPITAPASSAIGVGAQPTTLSSAASGTANPGPWETVVGCCESFGEFLRKLVINALEGLRSGLGVAIGWFGGKPDSVTTPATLAVNWQLPPQQQPATTGPVANDPFSQLPITDVEQQKIYTIVHALGGTWASLMWNQTAVRKCGDEVQHVHPLKFLEYVFKHPDLPKDLESCGKSSMTWDPFVQGLSEKLRREAATLPGCKAGFARSLNVNLNDLNPFFASANWEGMVKFLLDVKLGRRISVWVEPQPEPPPPAPTSDGSSTTMITGITTATTTASTPNTPAVLTPTPVLRIADLPFENGDEQIIGALIVKYAQNSRWRLVWEHNAINLQWSHLGERHPIKLLSFLYSKPELMSHINTIFQYTGTKALFMRALTFQLARFPFIEVRPYLNEFATLCHLDAARVNEQVQNGNWQALVEDLQRSYQAHPPVLVS